jgi:alpha-tubulin suppressor-like RCC1 family protein
MKKMFTSAVMAFVVLAACNTNPTTNPITNIETSKQPSIDSKKSQVLGVLEVELSSEQGSVSSAKFIPTGSTGLSAKGIAVPITASNWVFTPGTTTYMTDANFKYLQNTITLENKTGTSFSNLAMYALNTPSNIGGTAFSAVKTLAGVALTEPTASTVARAVMPTHGMTNTTTVDPNKADLMLYTPSEAAAVQAQLIAPNFTLSSPTVLEYGFLARNLLGGRDIGSSAAVCPNDAGCNKGTITWAFKFPLSLPNSSNLGKFTLKYVVVNGTGRISAMTANGAHTCILTNSGKIKCWGRNDVGELGNGTVSSGSTAKDVVGLLDPIKKVTAGFNHTCAVTDLGTVKCWGQNNYNVLGNTSISGFSATPMDVLNLNSLAKNIDTATTHTCILTNSRDVKCWGFGNYGALGNSNGTTSLTPVDVAGLGENVQKVATGDHHSCALTDYGGVKCWGFNIDGQIGDGSRSNRLSPVDVSGLNASVKEVEAGHWHTCALTNSGGVKCWGFNGYGELGDGTFFTRDTPVDVLGLTSGIQAIALSYSHTCALTTLGQVKCWGYNNSGQVGSGDKLNTPIPTLVGGLEGPAKAIAAGSNHTCALLISDKVQCWGNNFLGQLGNGDGINSLTPVSVLNLSDDLPVVGAP